MAGVPWAIYDPVSVVNRLRVFIFGDNSHATHAIHLLRPLRRLRATRLCALRYVTSPRLSAMRNDIDAQLRQEWRLFRPHVIVISRYYGDLLPSLLNLAHQTSTPLIAHIDDDHLSTSEPVLDYSPQLPDTQQRLEAVRRLTNESNLLFVPTQRLAEIFRHSDTNAPISVARVQSAVSPREIRCRGSTPNDDSAGETRIGYMGSRGHSPDLDMIADELERFLADHPRVMFHCFGTVEIPLRLRQFGSRVISHRVEKSYDEFLAKLASLNWGIGLAPLRATRFNEVRTYTKWVEYSAAGIATIASPELPYVHACSGARGLFAAQGEWYRAMERLMDDCTLRRQTVAAAQTFLRQHCLLTHMEAQLLDVFGEAGVKLSVASKLAFGSLRRLLDACNV